MLKHRNLVPNQEVACPTLGASVVRGTYVRGLEDLLLLKLTEGARPLKKPDVIHGTTWQ